MTDWTASDLILARPDDAPVRDGFRIGSDDHKRLFCRTLLDTFNPYKPAVLDWPKLDDEARARLVNLPIWDIAVQTEGKASLRVKSYAANVSRDEWLRRAVELNAFEEARHKHVLSNLVQAYGIVLEPEPEYVRPRDIEWAFMVTGFSECIDSFFAFGLFDLARRSGFFPEELVDTFEPVMQEEGRHILFFVNWVAWRRRQPAVLEAALVRAARAGRLAVPDLGADRHRAEHRRRAGAGQQLHRDRRGRARPRRLPAPADGHLPGRERPAAWDLRPTPAPADVRASDGAAGAKLCSLSP